MSKGIGSTRAQALARLTPALVHRLNNLLAVVSGRCDLWSGRGEPGDRFVEQVAQMSAASSEATRVLRALSLYTSDREPDPEELAPDRVIQTVEVLLAPFAKESGVPLFVEARGGAALVVADLRRLVQALGTALFSALEAQRGRPVRRARLDASAFGGARPRVAFTVAACGEVARAGEPEGAAAEVEALGREPGRSARRRTLGTASAWRLVLPARAHDDGRVRAAARHDASRLRIVLAVPDELLADLIASVLEEEGYRVAQPATPLAAAPAEGDLLIVDADAGDAHLIAGLLARTRRTLMIGDPPPGARPTAFLAKPFGPDALLDAVRGLASDA